MITTTGQTKEFGYVQVWESNLPQSTDLETWVEAMSRVTKALHEGTYRISWYFELRVATVGPQLDSRAAAQFLIDGNIKGSAVTELDDWVPVCGFDRYAASAAETPDLSIEFRRDPAIGGNDNIEVRKMRIGIEEIQTA